MFDIIELMQSKNTSRQHGFTVIELMIVGVVLVVSGFLVFIQMNDLEIRNHDVQRKTAINAMHYALEEVYYKQHKSYPEHLSTSVLPSVDPDLFTDPDGFTLGEEILTEAELNTIVEQGNASETTEKRLSSLGAGKSPNYYYEPTDCNEKGNCKSYTLYADLAKEGRYKKESLHD